MAKLGQIVAYALSVVAQQPVLPRWMQDLNEAQQQKVQRQQPLQPHQFYPVKHTYPVPEESVVVRIQPAQQLF